MTYHSIPYMEKPKKKEGITVMSTPFRYEDILDKYLQDRGHTWQESIIKDFLQKQEGKSKIDISIGGWRFVLRKCENGILSGDRYEIEKILRI